jgi:hypothetical protein
MRCRFAGKRCDRETVAFSPEAAHVKTNAMVSLVAAWTPIVESVMALSCAHLDPATLTEFVSEDDAVDRTAKAVGAVIYASRASLPLGDFPDLVSTS